MQQQNNNEELIDIISGISNHQEILNLCVADYLTLRTILESENFAKEVIFVHEKRENHPEIWLKYQENEQIVSVLNNTKNEDEKYQLIFSLSLKYHQRNVTFIPKYLTDYFCLREKYNISSMLVKSFSEMKRCECLIPCDDFIELNKGYSWAKSRNEIADNSYFELGIFDKEKITSEINTAKSFLNKDECDKLFLETHIGLLEHKLTQTFV